MKADIAQFMAEQAKSRTEQKAKLQPKIDESQTRSSKPR